MAEKKLFIHTEFIKLEQALKLSAVCMSGGEAKERICAGQVLVNDAPCSARGKKLSPGDRFSVEGEQDTFVITAEQA